MIIINRQLGITDSKNTLAMANLNQPSFRHGMTETLKLMKYIKLKYKVV